MRASKNASTLNTLTIKVDGSGEGGGSQKQLLTPNNRDEWQAHGLPSHVICKKPRRGVDIMAINASPRPSPPDYPINFLVKERRHKNSICKRIFYLHVSLSAQNQTHKCCPCLRSVYWAIKNKHTQVGAIWLWTIGP